MIKQAIIPLAGLGTRLLPLTSVFAKELLPINGKPGIEYILDECIEAGIKEIIFIISKKKMMIKKYFYNDKDINLNTTLMLSNCIDINDENNNNKNSNNFEGKDKEKDTFILSNSNYNDNENENLSDINSNNFTPKYTQNYISTLNYSNINSNNIK